MEGIDAGGDERKRGGGGKERREEADVEGWGSGEEVIRKEGGEERKVWSVEIRVYENVNVCVSFEARTMQVRGLELGLVALTHDYVTALITERQQNRLSKSPFSVHVSQE